MFRKLSEMLNSRTRAFELMLVKEGIKPCARIAFSAEPGSLFSDLGLVAVSSDFKVAMEWKGGYSTKGEMMPKDDPRKGHIFFYIAKNKEAALLAKHAEERGDIRVLGQALGYPSCCIDFFIANRSDEIRSENDYIKPAIKNSSGESFDFHLNVFARYFDFALVSHAPHSLDCPASKEMAVRSLNVLAKLDPQIALSYQRFMSGIALYSDERVVMLPGARSVEDHGPVFSTSEGPLPTGGRVFRFV